MLRRPSLLPILSSLSVNQLRLLGFSNAVKKVQFHGALACRAHARQLCTLWSSQPRTLAMSPSLQPQSYAATGTSKVVIAFPGSTQRRHLAETCLSTADLITKVRHACAVTAS